MAEYEKKVRKLLIENGCTFVRRSKGDHDIWHSPVSGINFTVDGKIKSRFTANAVLKQNRRESRSGSDGGKKLRRGRKVYRPFYNNMKSRRKEKPFG